MGLDEFSVLEIGLMVFILVAFLAFFGAFLMLQKKRRDRDRQRFSKKKKQLEQTVVMVEERRISHRRDQLRQAEKCTERL